MQKAIDHSLSREAIVLEAKGLADRLERERDEAREAFARRLERERDEARKAFAIVTDQLVQVQMDNRKLHEEIQRLRDIEP